MLFKLNYGHFDPFNVECHPIGTRSMLNVIHPIQRYWVVIFVVINFRVVNFL